MVKLLPEHIITQEFGDPYLFLNQDGSIKPSWESLIIDYADIPGDGLPLAWMPQFKVRRFKCHRRLKGIFNAVMEELFNTPSIWGTINDFGGCYNWRMMRKGKNLSRHCWGLAIDLDCRDNPMGSRGIVDIRVPEIFEKHGFVWGGHFSRRYIDPMHFEFNNMEKLNAG